MQLHYNIKKQGFQLETLFFYIDKASICSIPHSRQLESNCPAQRLLEERRRKIPFSGIRKDHHKYFTLIFGAASDLCSRPERRA